ncbi:MAG: cell division protein FtsQ/DivIB [Flavobacteriales bacterium]
MKRFLKIAIWFIYLVGVGFLFGFVESKRDTVVVHPPDIYIEQAYGHLFVTKDNVLEELSNIGFDFNGETLREIDVNRMERVLNGVPGVKNAEVYKNHNGNLTIKIKQRNPIVRIFNSRGISAYIDEEGKSMPTSEQYTAKVLVFNGYIEDPLYNFDITTAEASDSLTKVYVLGDIYHLAKYIKQDSLFSALIAQVYVNSKQEFELISRVSDHRILFGTIEDYTEKFKKLEAFYTKGVKPEELNLYDTITLKYNKLIICSKR